MILLIGDLILDEYVSGVSTRLSPEAPVPVITNTTEKIVWGGAGNVYQNLISLGDKVSFIYNKDQRTIKRRILCDDRIMCRIDIEEYTPFIPDIDDIQSIRYAILSDYNKGVLHDSKDIITKLNNKGIKCIVDPKKSFDNYENCWLIKANKKEFEQELGKTIDYNTIDDECLEISQKYNIDNIIITLGGDGVYYYRKEYSKHYQTIKRNVIDVTGAGDVFIAALTHFLNKDESIDTSIHKANKLASISVEKLGTYVLRKEDIDSVNSITVFTNGCFDILHRGHIEYLRKSKQLGDKLIVGLNSDNSVKKLKGVNRPINNETDRKIVLESLEFVDEVIIFDEDTPYELIKRISPNIITKGGDYREEDVVGNDICKVVIIPYVDGYSTTGVIDERIRNS